MYEKAILQILSNLHSAHLDIGADEKMSTENRCKEEIASDPSRITHAADTQRKTF